MAGNLDDEGPSVLARLVRIEVLLETEFKSHNREFKNLSDKLGDHEIRLRSSERWRYALPISVVAAIVSAIGAVVAALGR